METDIDAFHMYMYNNTCTCIIMITNTTFAVLAFLIVRICCAITDNTSISIRLNSSKQHHAPDWAKPEKNFPIIYRHNTVYYTITVHSILYMYYTITVHSIVAITLKSRPSEQLNTTHCLASALAKSLVVSVFPVPAGPAGAPPKSSCNAPMRQR